MSPTPPPPSETEEQSALAHALTQIRDCISHVDGQVSDFENAARLRDIAQRLEPKSQCLLKDGRPFSREDLMEASRTLQNEATFTIKESSGKLKGDLPLDFYIYIFFFFSLLFVKGF